MKHPKAAVAYRPFENLKALLKEKSFPLAARRKDKPVSGVVKRGVCEKELEAEALARLEDLVGGRGGFIISDTPEYMEGLGYGVNPEVAKRLHQGDFSIQAHIDLHGLGVADAREAFERFFKEAILSGKRAVLVIHGRGLSSPAEPVLKAKVKEWLTCGPWRKWVIAFTSARACDGATGGTYVLLRQRPATKRYRKRVAKR